MVVAARRGRHADEHAPGEERRRHLLQPQPRCAQRARDDVENTVSVNMPMHTPHRTISSASSGSSARHLSWRWRCRTSARHVGHGAAFRTARDRARRTGRPARARAVRCAGELLHFADELEDLDRMRAELGRELVLDRRAAFMNPRLVDVLDDLDADRLRASRRNPSRASAPSRARASPPRRPRPAPTAAAAASGCSRSCR